MTLIEGVKVRRPRIIPDERGYYDSPDEYRLPYNDPSIPYSWEVRHG